MSKVQGKYKTDYRKLSKNKGDKKDEKKSFWTNLKFLLPKFNKPKDSKNKSKSNLKIKKERISIMERKNFLLIFTPFWKMGEVTVGVLSVRQNYLKVVFGIIFVVIIFRFAQLQLIAVDSQLALQSNTQKTKGEVVVSRRGQIFIGDLSQGKNNIAITSTQLQIEIFADTSILKILIVKKDVNLEDLAIDLTSSLNLPYTETLSKLKDEIQKDEPTSYLILKSGVTEEQRNGVV